MHLTGILPSAQDDEFIWVSNGCPYLATERAGVFSMLGDFNFLDHLPQRRAITRAIFTNDPHLLGALGLWTT